MELELMKEDKTGDLYLLEINPRFPAWVYLAVGCGQNHPEMLVKMAMGETVEPMKNYDVGKMFIRYSYDIICDLDKYASLSVQGEV
jgi:carbamoyl-phosphate synthase large subunit